jgi:SAM-dependent methyltransferase
MKNFSEYAKYYEVIYKTKKYKQEADFAYKWAERPRSILELGCGMGRHAKFWAKKSNIVGIDCSPQMLSLAYQHPNITYKCMKIDNNLQRLGQFDCVMAMFNVMGYALLEDCIQYLPLKPGGHFIFDVWDASKFKTQPPEPRIKWSKTWYRLAVPTQMSERLLRIDYFIVDKNKGLILHEKHLVEGYFHKDIEDLCKKADYEIIEVKNTDNWIVWYKLQKL